MIAFEDQSHGDSGDGWLNGIRRIHQRKTAAADGGHRRGAVGFGDVGFEADHVGECLLFRQESCDKGTFCKFAMADFASSRRADASHFSDRERREGVLEIEAADIFAVEIFIALAPSFRRRACNSKSLGFSACEEGASVGAGQKADFDIDRADLSQDLPSLRLFSFKIL